MNAEESLSMFCSLLFINLLCSLRDLFFDVCQLTLHATNINTVNFTSLFANDLLKHSNDVIWVLE
jgi:hypothetical protein